MPRNPLREFISDYLTPSERLSQALYGLILVLTVISAIGITVSRNQQSTGTLLTAALGTSVAWGMVEVFIIGVIVALVKLTHYGSLIPGIALWSLGGLTLLLAATASSFNIHDVWNRVHQAPRRGGGE